MKMKNDRRIITIFNNLLNTYIFSQLTGKRTKKRKEIKFYIMKKVFSSDIFSYIHLNDYA